MIGARLKRARAASGLSMKALGEKAGVSANMIKKYEHDKSMPSSSVLIKLAQTLGVRSEYFFRPVNIELSQVEYRKRAGTLKSTLKRIEADVLEQAERWQELANLWPRFPVSKFDQIKGLPGRLDDMEQVEKVAEKVRTAWKLGMNPIPDLVDLLESHGVLVIITEADDRAQFSGLQAVVAEQPVIVISANWPGDHQRFTLAHEFGHLLLHKRLGPALDEEKACHRFAGAFLLPAVSIRQQLGEKRHNLEIYELFLLKHEFGLSMQACLYRAADLGIIDEPVRRRLFKLFSSRGWRREEPGEAYLGERTVLFRQLVCRALGEGIINESKAAELLKTPLMAFRKMRNLESANAGFRL